MHQLVREGRPTGFATTRNRGPRDAWLEHWHDLEVHDTGARSSLVDGQRINWSDSTQKAVRRIVVDVTFEVALSAKQVSTNTEINTRDIAVGPVHTVSDTQRKRRSRRDRH